MLPTPNELDTYTQPDDEKEEELLICPELINQLSRGLVLQTDCSVYLTYDLIVMGEKNNGLDSDLENEWVCFC